MMRPVTVPSNIARTEQIKWWDALDAMFGVNRRRDLGEALRLARKCQHPDGQWLCSLFPDGGKVEPEMAMSVLEAQGEDPRALLIRLHVDRRSCVGDYGVVLLRKAAEAGYAPAQALLVGFCPSRDKLAWAEKAAAQGHRDGLYFVGRQLWEDEGCEHDRIRALELVREAAEMEQSGAQFFLGQFAYSENDWQRYRLWGRAAARGCDSAIYGLQGAVVLQLQRREQMPDSERAVFELGAACRGHAELLKPMLFGKKCSMEELSAAERCVELHEKWCDSAKTAIDCWIGVGRKLEVVKDIRGLIARLLWQERAAWCK